MASDDSTAGQSKGPSLVVQLGVLAVLTVGAVAAGWMSGSMLGGGSPATQEAGAKRSEPIRTSEAAGAIGIVHIDPITTNLATPADMWIRLELSLVFADRPDIAVAEQIHQDLLAYMRTVKIHQIEGASGFQHLKADLSERAAIRSDGTVREVLIRTMLLE